MSGRTYTEKRGPCDSDPPERSIVVGRLQERHGRVYRAVTAFLCFRYYGKEGNLCISKVYGSVVGSNSSRRPLAIFNLVITDQTHYIQQAGEGAEEGRSPEGRRNGYAPILSE